MRRIINSVNWRINFLFTNKSLTLKERIGIISHLRPKQSGVIKRSLLKRMVNADKKYFLLKNYQIYFEPDYKIENHDYFIQGITQVIEDAYFFPHFFSKKVKLNKGDTCFDLGASIGTTSMLFAKMVGKSGKVYAVEPVVHEVLECNLRENNIQNVILIPKGVSQSKGTAEIETSDFCLDSSIAKRRYAKKYYSKKKTIELTTIDALVDDLRLEKVDFIKMDIEGVEELAIRGAKKTINRFKPKWSISSYHIDFENQPQHSKLCSLLKQFGYEIEEKGKSYIFAY